MLTVLLDLKRPLFLDFRSCSDTISANSYWQTLLKVRTKIKNKVWVSSLLALSCSMTACFCVAQKDSGPTEWHALGGTDTSSTSRTYDPAIFMSLDQQKSPRKLYVYSKGWFAEGCVVVVKSAARGILCWWNTLTCASMGLLFKCQWWFFFWLLHFLHLRWVPFVCASYARWHISVYDTACTCGPGSPIIWVPDLCL